MGPAWERLTINNRREREHKEDIEIHFFAISVFFAVDPPVARIFDLTAENTESTKNRVEIRR